MPFIQKTSNQVLEAEASFSLRKKLDAPDSQDTPETPKTESQSGPPAEAISGRTDCTCGRMGCPALEGCAVTPGLDLTASAEIALFQVTGKRPTPSALTGREAEQAAASPFITVEAWTRPSSDPQTRVAEQLRAQAGSLRASDVLCLIRQLGSLAALADHFGTALLPVARYVRAAQALVAHAMRGDARDPRDVERFVALTNRFLEEERRIAALRASLFSEVARAG